MRWELLNFQNWVKKLMAFQETNWSFEESNQRMQNLQLLTIFLSQVLFSYSKSSVILKVPILVSTITLSVSFYLFMASSFFFSFCFKEKISLNLFSVGTNAFLKEKLDIFGSFFSTMSNFSTKYNGDLFRFAILHTCHLQNENWCW